MESLADGELLYGLEDGIARMRLNRPNKANAISIAMIEAILEKWHRLEADATVKALVISAAGKVFSGGVDLAIMDTGRTPPEETERYLALWDQMIKSLQRAAFPVIATIEGPAIAGGLSIAFACHLRIASTEARFAYPRVPQGHAPGRHNLTSLARVIGPGRARLVLLGARSVDAAEAAAWGLVDLVVAPERLEAETEALLARIRETPAPLVSITNRLIGDPENDGPWQEAARL